ncbi:MAG: dihydrodipicolinate synthase family protein [Rhodospirillales bacterium]|nr:dihydrodipicolinate synthase family protein [Rhodospirillales bacterium]
MAHFEGAFTVICTPFTEDGKRIDEKALRRHVDWQIEEGVPGLIPLGSTGEWLSVNDEERAQVIDAVVDQAKGRVPVIAGTAHEWTERAVRYSREAEKLGADGVMVIQPYYSSPTDDELFAHFRAISDAISIPIMLYNNTRIANVDIKPPLVARLSQLDNVRYIKEASGDQTRVRDIHRLVGPDKMIVFARYEAWRLGAKGWVSVCGNVAPALSAAAYRKTVTENDPEGGREIYNRLQPIMGQIDGDLYVSGTKAAMDLIGRSMGPPRMPRLPLPASKIPGLRSVLEDLGVLAKKAA